MAAGAWGNDGNTGDNSGHVRVYKYNRGTDRWKQLGLDLDGEAAKDFFGYSVALSSGGTIVAAGAKYGNDSSGYVRVFKEES